MNEQALDSYLCIDLTLKVKSKERQGKELNICVEYLNSKGKSAQTSAYVYIYLYINIKLYIHMHIYICICTKKRREQVINMKKKIFLESGLQTENKIKQISQINTTNALKKTDKASNLNPPSPKIGKLYHLMSKVLLTTIKITSENVANHVGSTSHYASQEFFLL